MADGKVPGALRRKILERDHFTCAKCGIVGFPVRRTRSGWGYYTEIPNVYLSIDHITPWSAGGRNEESNLRTLCTACNTGKGRRQGDDFKTATLMSWRLIRRLPMHMRADALRRVREHAEKFGGGA